MGVSTESAVALFIAFCLVDIAVAGAVLGRWRSAMTAGVQLALVAGYTVALTVVAPGLWLDPLGPLLKNGAVALPVLALAALDSDR